MRDEGSKSAGSTGDRSKHGTIRSAGLLSQIPLELIDPNPYQGRRSMDGTKLKELATNISRHGLLQPITVRAVEDRFQVIGGHRRLAAMQRLRDEAHARGDNSAFLNIEARVRSEVSEFDMALLMLVENSKREDMDVFDEAESLLKLMELNPELKTPKDVAAAVDESVDRVRRLLHLANAATIIKASVRDGVTLPTSGADGKTASSDTVKERREQRHLDLSGALEFDRLHQHIARQKNDTKYDMRKVADEKVGNAIQRALREGWGVRRISAYVEDALAATRPNKDREAPKPTAPPFRRDERQLVIYRARLEAMSAEQKRELRAALEPMWQLVSGA